MLIQRTLEATIKNVSSTFPVLLSTGPRQVGKNTPYLGITTDYSTTDSGQIDTRLEAFIEMLGESE